MGWLRSKALVLALALAVTPTLVAPAAPSAAQVELLQISHAVGVTLSIPPNGGTQTVQASCPANQVPLSGYVAASATDDIRREFESFTMTSGGMFLTGLINFGTVARNVTAVARCVPASQLGNIFTLSGTFDALSDHVAEGTVSCPQDTIPVNASVTEPHSNDRTLLTSTPTADLTGWFARGWVGNPDDPDEVMTITVHCVDAGAMPGIRVGAHLDPVGWGAAASAECPSGLVPAFGGTQHVGGDRGAITVLAQPAATGWTSTTLSLSEGSMFTVVACVPNAYPTLAVTGSSGFTNSPSASWSFLATDPAAGGGYSIEYTCSFVSNGIGSLAEPCTSPVSWSSLADGSYAISVSAETSDGRESPTVEREVTVDTVAPTATMSAPPLFHLTRSATPTWAGQDTTSGIASYELRRRRTPLLGEIGTWTTPTLLPATATSRTFTDLIPGSTYCYGIRPTDRATNTGAWRTRCTAIPLDDRALTHSPGWTDTTPAPYYEGTATETTTQGATLTVRATTKRMALIAWKCPTCGTVRVSIGDTTVATVDLTAATARRHLIPLPPLAAVTTGTVELEVTSTGKLVRVDALSLSRH